MQPDVKSTKKRDAVERVKDKADRVTSSPSLILHLRIKDTDERFVKIGVIWIDWTCVWEPAYSVLVRGIWNYFARNLELFVLQILLLQKPSQKSKSRDHVVHLKRWLELWKCGDIQSLLQEGRCMHSTLSHQSIKTIWWWSYCMKLW